MRDPLGPRRPKALLLDLFHTLVSVAGHFPRTWEELGLDREEYERHLFLDAPGRALGRVRDAAQGLRELVHGIDPSLPAELVDDVARRRVERFDHTLRHPEPAVVDALGRARSAGMRLALVSNACFDEIGAWEESPLAPHFDAAVFSCEVGAVKPDPEIYRHALDRLGVRPADALFVGDGGSDEHRGARRVGLGTVLVTRLLALTWPHHVEPRRAHADWEFEDVPALVDALLDRRAEEAA